MKYLLNTRTVDPQTVIITCQGEMDTLAVEELHQAVDPLLGDTVSHLVFDLAAVEYVSSSVLSFLMATQGKAQEKGGKVSLVAASDLVRQVFDLAALDALFEFHAKLEDLGIVLQAPAASLKGKALKKEKSVETKGAKPVLSKGKSANTPSREAREPEKERVASAGGRERREIRTVEKIQPSPEKRSWKDYGVWIGIAVVVGVSLAVSLYLYAVEP
jgi:anti-anti-sigma factor